MKKVLLVMLALALTVPAFAIDKHGLLEAGLRLFYWMPQGNFGEAYDASLGFGAKVGYGLSSNMEIVGEAWYGLADFNESYWGLGDGGAEYELEDGDAYLTQFSAGARFNFTPYSQFDPYAQVTAGYYMWAMYKEVGIDEDGDGDVDYTEYRLVEDDSTRKFGINVRLGGEFFTTNTMSIDVGVGWNSIFSVNVPEPVDTDDDGFYDDFDVVEETVNILTFSAGANFYF